MVEGSGEGQPLDEPYCSLSNKSMQCELVLTILQDKTCRRLLDVITAEPLTAKELATKCDISSPTVYRKLDLLVKAEFVEASTRIESNGNHTSVYQIILDSLTVSVDTEGDLTMDISKQYV